MILNLPYDIKWNIAHFIDDIDIRRFFNIYGKIDLKKYKILNQIIRKNEMNLGNYTRYNFHENSENTIFRYNNIDSVVTICDDLMDITIMILDDIVKYRMEIFKLKKKPYENYVNKNDIYYKGLLENQYYWKYIIIEYIIY
jgi:hypothetical protein